MKQGSDAVTLKSAFSWYEEHNLIIQCNDGDIKDINFEKQEHKKADCRNSRLRIIK